jgi:hypothetical protein
MVDLEIKKPVRALECNELGGSFQQHPILNYLPSQGIGSFQQLKPLILGESSLPTLRLRRKDLGKVVY